MGGWGTKQNTKNKPHFRDIDKRLRMARIRGL